MLFESKEAKGIVIEATDGEFGKIEQFFFDDEKWTVRFIVVNTGNFMIKNEVLISPISFKKIDFKLKKAWVNLSKSEIENGPDIASHLPISRQEERKFYSHYNWPSYWGQRGLWGIGPYGIPWDQAEEYENDQFRKNFQAGEGLNQKAEESDEEIRLKSSQEVMNYKIQANDDEFGHVEDFIIDDESFAIRYLKIDTVSWLPSKSVLISPQWIEEINWLNKNVIVNLSKESIQSAPKYDRNDLNRYYEDSLYNHYQLSDKKYWAAESFTRNHKNSPGSDESIDINRNL